MTDIDLERLSSPLPTNGAGQNLRYEPLYDKIRTARFEEDSSLSRGVWMRDLKKADWNEVLTLCVHALEHETKDLQIVCWLCESLCHLQQWNGLVQSLDLVHKFSQNCWECCYPNEDDSLEHRVRIFEWFAEKMSERLLFMPIIRPSGMIQQSLDLSTWLAAMNFDAVSRKSAVSESKIQEAENSGQVTLRRFRTIARQTNVNEILIIQDAVDNVAQKLATLSDFLHKQCGSQSPSFKTINDNLSNIAQICKFALDGRVKITAQSSSQTLENAQHTDPLATTAKNESLSELQKITSSMIAETEENKNDDAIQEKEPDDVQINIQQTLETTENSHEEVTISNCRDAYKAVEDLADFLIEADPQSPGPYLIKMISSWSGKPLPAVLDDVATGSSEGHKILKVLSDVVRRVVV
jgi:type VI secretion system protein ImpA